MEKRVLRAVRKWDAFKTKPQPLLLNWQKVPACAFVKRVLGQAMICGPARRLCETYESGAENAIPAASLPPREELYAGLRDRLHVKVVRSLTCCTGRRCCTRKRSPWFFSSRAILNCDARGTNVYGATDVCTLVAWVQQVRLLRSM